MWPPRPVGVRGRLPGDAVTARMRTAVHVAADEVAVLGDRERPRRDPEPRGNEPKRRGVVGRAVEPAGVEERVEGRGVGRVDRKRLHRHVRQTDRMQDPPGGAAVGAGGEHRRTGGGRARAAVSDHRPELRRGARATHEDHAPCLGEARRVDVLGAGRRPASFRRRSSGGGRCLSRARARSGPTPTRPSSSTRARRAQWASSSGRTQPWGPRCSTSTSRCAPTPSRSARKARTIAVVTRRLRVWTRHARHVGLRPARVARSSGLRRRARRDGSPRSGSWRLRGAP